MSSLHANDYRGTPNKSLCKAQLSAAARFSPLQKTVVQVLVPEMGFAAVNGGNHFVQASAADEAMISHFLSDFPEVSRYALSKDLLLSQELLGSDDLGFYLNLRAFAQRNAYTLQDTLENFLGLKMFILEAAAELRPSEISFGPQGKAIEISNQDILDIFDLYDGKLPDDTVQILANAIYAGAASSRELMDTLGFTQKYSIEGIELIQSLKFLRETISISKRVEGFAHTDTEEVFPSYAESLSLYEIMNNVPDLNNSKKLRDKIKSYEDLPHRNDELDGFDDVIYLLSLEYGFTMRDPNL